MQLVRCDALTRGCFCSEADPEAKMPRGLPPNAVPFRRYLGGAEEIRTPDLRRAKAALSQLSYGPIASLAAARWAIVDSNHRPRSYQDRALTS
jgi:hypothetical protein